MLYICDTAFWTQVALCSLRVQMLTWRRYIRRRIRARHLLNKFLARWLKASTVVALATWRHAAVSTAVVAYTIARLIVYQVLAVSMHHQYWQLLRSICSSQLMLH
jgi:hypothetical protein